MTDQDILMQGPGGANVALETIDLMRLHGVPPTSANYEVWLAYRLASNQALREAVDAGRVPHRSVKDELRSNLAAHLRAGRTLFPGIIGYEDTVVPQVVNAILSRHNFILLGLRGQAKSP